MHSSRREGDRPRRERRVPSPGAAGVTVGRRGPARREQYETLTLLDDVTKCAPFKRAARVDSIAGGQLAGTSWRPRPRSTLSQELPPVCRETLFDAKNDGFIGAADCSRDASSGIDSASGVEVEESASLAMICVCHRPTPGGTCRAREARPMKSSVVGRSERRDTTTFHGGPISYRTALSPINTQFMSHAVRRVRASGWRGEVFAFAVAAAGGRGGGRMCTSDNGVATRGMEEFFVVCC